MKKALFIFFALLTAIPCLAIDFDVYGDIKLGIWGERRERYYDDTNVVIIDTINDTTFDTSVTMGSDTLPVFSTSWIPCGNMGFKLKGERLTGCVEMGLYKNLYDAGLTSVTGLKMLKRSEVYFYLRKWYVELQFNEFFSLLAGQDYAPANFVVSNQGYYDHNSLTNLGCLYTGRTPMVQLTMGGDIGDAFNLKGRVACLRADTIVIAFQGEDRKAETETRAPKVEGRVDVSIDKDIFSGSLGIVGGFQRFYSFNRDKQNIPKDSFRVAVDGFVIAAELDLKLGPVTLAGTITKCNNPGAYGVAAGNRWEWRGGASDPKTKEIFSPIHHLVQDSNSSDFGEFKMHNADMIQYAAIIKVEPWEVFGFEAGYGFQTVEHDYEAYNEMWDDRFALYFQTKISLFDQMFVVTPEVGQFYWGDEYRKGGRFTYWGLMITTHF